MSATIEKPSITNDFCRFRPAFLRVVPLLRSHTLTHPNEILIICGHILALQPPKILARSAHRGPSNRPWHGATCVILALLSAEKSEIQLKMYRPVAYYPEMLPMSVIPQRKPCSLGFVICQPGPEKSGVSNMPRTFGHPVES